MDSVESELVAFNDREMAVNFAHWRASKEQYLKNI